MCTNPNILYHDKSGMFYDAETGEIKRKFRFIGSVFDASSKSESDSFLLPHYHHDWYAKVFDIVDGSRTVIVREPYRNDYILVPCGKCLTCRLERSRVWAARCVFEAQMHNFNSFLTLTYDDEHLPSDYGLCKRDLQLFWKRLRKKLPNLILRYFACGEYGETTSRPHYHAILFGYMPFDRVLYSLRGGIPLYESSFLDSVWQNGAVRVGEVTFDSAAYVAGYIMKKQIGSDDYYQGREPPFVAMSRRPGIAYDWFQKYKNDVFPNDFIIIKNGIKMKPPRYFETIYDRDFDVDSDVLLDDIKSERMDNLNLRQIRSPTEFTLDRLNAKDRYQVLLQKERIRDYEISK